MHGRGEGGCRWRLSVHVRAHEGPGERGAARAGSKLPLSLRARDACTYETYVRAAQSGSGLLCEKAVRREARARCWACGRARRTQRGGSSGTCPGRPAGSPLPPPQETPTRMRLATAPEYLSASAACAISPLSCGPPVRVCEARASPRASSSTKRSGTRSRVTPLGGDSGGSASLRAWRCPPPQSGPEGAGATTGKPAGPKPAKRSGRLLFFAFCNFAPPDIRMGLHATDTLFTE